MYQSEGRDRSLNRSIIVGGLIEALAISMAGQEDHSKHSVRTHGFFFLAREMVLGLNQDCLGGRTESAWSMYPGLFDC
jgi:hypothetical protein